MMHRKSSLRMSAVVALGQRPDLFVDGIDENVGGRFQCLCSRRHDVERSRHALHVEVDHVLGERPTVGVAGDVGR